MSGERASEPQYMAPRHGFEPWELDVLTYAPNECGVLFNSDTGCRFAHSAPVQPSRLASDRHEMNAPGMMCELT